MHETVPAPTTRQSASCDPGQKHASKRHGLCHAHRDTSPQARTVEPGDRIGGSRFTQPDPIEGGCANEYTYAWGDPLNNPDLSGQGTPGRDSLAWQHGGTCGSHSVWGTVGRIALGVGAVAGIVAIGVATAGVGDVIIAGGVTVGGGATAVGFGAGAIETTADCIQNGYRSVGCLGSVASLGLGGVGYLSDVERAGGAVSGPLTGASIATSDVANASVASALAEHHC